MKEFLNKEQGIKYTLMLMVMLIALIGIAIISLCTGSASISFGDILGIIGGADNETARTILLKIRLPRMLMSMLCGGALALSGFLLQTFFSNPIAGPYILGISSGAKLFVAVAMVWGIKYFNALSGTAMVAAAFVGAMASTLFVIFLSKRIPTMSVLLVGGIMVGYICSAITELFITFADDNDIVNLRAWSLGSFSGQSLENCIIAGLIILAAFILAFLMAKPIGALQLGENYAMSMGVNIKSFRVLLIVLSCLLAAVVTAFAGPVSFVGIAVPQLTKRLFNTSKPIVIIPAAFLGGGIFCMAADLAARSIFAPTELSISTVTSVLGAPVVIYMLLRRETMRS